MQVAVRFYRAILDALPLPVFLVDENLHVYEINGAAAKLFGTNSDTLLMQRNGEILHCLSAKDSGENCGHGEHCGDCIVRTSVLDSLAGHKIHRRRMKLQTVRSGIRTELELLVTAAPLPADEGKLTLLILEDLTEVTLLKNLIPICMHCKKIRDDHQFWRQVESYFHQFIGVDFSHGVCPECMSQYYPDTRS